MKLGEIAVHKNLGTYQLVVEPENDFYKADRYYEVRHFTGLTVTASTVKEAKKCLEDFEATANEIRGAIQLLKRHGYRVYQEVE